MATQLSRLAHAVRRLALRDASDGELLESFVNHEDTAALAELVRRHAPMVWGVARRLLRRHQDAEDAFQATFLVLVQKAGAVREKELVANWLYGVAHQTAVRMRAMSAKRELREQQVTTMPETVSEAPDLWNDLQPILDEELSRLPEKYRAIIVWCDLEEMTRQDVARRLGCPEGTVASRLARARAMLAKRLARHGLAVSGGALATAVAHSAATAAAPAPLVAATIEAAGSVVAGKVLSAGVISATVIALTQGVMQTMLVNKIKKVLIVLVVALAVGGIGFGFRDSQAPAQSARPASDQKAQAQPVASDEGGLGGLTPDGTPEKLRAELDALAKKIARAQHDWLEARAEIVKLERLYLEREAQLRKLTGTAPARTVDIGEVQPVQKTVKVTTIAVGEGAKPAPRTDLEQRNKLLEKKLQEMDRRIKELEKRLENQKQ
jgi:RNA polymerase sigma factor (sigma-70 family)